MCRSQLLTRQVRVCGRTLASEGVKPPDGSEVTHSLRATGRVCGQWCQAPAREKQRSCSINRTQTCFGPKHCSQPVALSPGGRLAVSGESLTVSAWGRVGVGVGGCLWNLVGRGQRLSPQSPSCRGWESGLVALKSGGDWSCPKIRAQLLCGSRQLGLSFL